MSKRPPSPSSPTARLSKRARPDLATDPDPPHSTRPPPLLPSRRVAASSSPLPALHTPKSTKIPAGWKEGYKPPRTISKGTETWDLTECIPSEERESLRRKKARWEERRGERSSPEQQSSVDYAQQRVAGATGPRSSPLARMERVIRADTTGSALPTNRDVEVRENIIRTGTATSGTVPHHPFAPYPTHLSDMYPQTTQPLTPRPAARYQTTSVPATDMTYGLRVPNGVPGCLAGLTFVFTGELVLLQREQAKELVQRYGGRSTIQPSKRTDFVVTGALAGPTKLDKVEAFGLGRLDEAGFYDLIRDRSAAISSFGAAHVAIPGAGSLVAAQSIPSAATVNASAGRVATPIAGPSTTGVALAFIRAPSSPPASPHGYKSDYELQPEEWLTGDPPSRSDRSRTVAAYKHLSKPQIFEHLKSKVDETLVHMPRLWSPQYKGNFHVSNRLCDIVDKVCRLVSPTSRQMSRIRAIGVLVYLLRSIETMRSSKLQHFFVINVEALRDTYLGMSELAQGLTNEGVAEWRRREMGMIRELWALSGEGEREGAFDMVRCIAGRPEPEVLGRGQKSTIKPGRMPRS